MQSQWHECRLCALLMLVERFRKGDDKDRKLIYDFYLSQTDRINNWDLVDLSAPGIVGEYLKDKSREDLYRLADSGLLWEQRIAVVSTYTLIKNGDFCRYSGPFGAVVASSARFDAESGRLDAA